MRRLLRAPFAYLADLAVSCRRAWVAFFFAPADPTALGLVRVVVGALLFWNVAVLGLDLRAYLGSDGWIGPEAARHYLADHAPWAWSFWFHVSDPWLPLAWAACLVAVGMFTVGLGTRLTAVLAWAVAVSTVRHAPAALFGFDQMLSTWLFYLAVFGASGQALSLDRLLARFRTLSRKPTRTWAAASGVPVPSVSANLSLRMIQLHLLLVYGSAGLAKLRGTEWWDGTAMEMIILTPEFRRFDLVWLAGYPWLLNLLTHGGLFLEISFPVLIWVRKLRPLMLASIVMMHLGIDLLLGLTEFGLAMLAANLAFVSGPWLRGLVAGPDQPVGQLVFEPGCRSRRRLAALVAAADPDRVVTVREFDPDHGPTPSPWLFLGADGRSAAGPDALRRAARAIPLLWPVALFGLLPGSGLVLRRWTRPGRPGAVDLRAGDLVTASAPAAERVTPTRAVLSGPAAPRRRAGTG